MRNLALSIAAIALVTGPASGRTPMDQKNWDTLLKHYPKRALAAGEQGKVGFDVTLDRAGQPTTCQVTYSSGHPMLDNETCEVVLMHVVFQPPRDAQGNRLNTFTTEGVIDWRIPGNSAKIAAPVKLAAGDAPEKKVCKRQLRIGSLAGYERICMTSHEWDRNRGTYQEDAQDNFRKGFTACNPGEGVVC